MREKLEANAIKAALDLFDVTGGPAAFVLTVPNTSPPLYVACGEAKDIAKIIQIVLDT